MGAVYYLHIMNYVNNLHFCQPKGLLGCQVVEEPDEVVDVLLVTLDIEEEQARVNEMKTGDGGGLGVCGSTEGLGYIRSAFISNILGCQLP